MMFRPLVACLLWAVAAHAAPQKKSKPPPRKVAAKPAARTQKQPPKHAKSAPKTDVEKLGAGVVAFGEADYAGARKLLGPLEARPLHNGDYVLFFLAQSELLDGKAEDAARHFDKLAGMDSRFRALAKWRAADARWEAGQLDEAKKLYGALLAGNPPSTVEPAVARFRLGEYRKVYVQFPQHPLAETALAQLKDPLITPLERIARARTMTVNRAWGRAIDELAQIPVDLAGPLRDEADFWIGMNHFRMRHGYDIAAQKLLAVWSRMPGDLKVDALFHGARALSRADLDDQAIEKYREVVAKFPHTKLGAEASFLVGWLDFNRGHYKDALPGLEETLKKYGASQWEDDARWYLGFSRWMVGDAGGALVDFEKLAEHEGALTGGKGLYWKGRALDKLGKSDEAHAVWQKLAAQYPFSYYAQSGRARLKDAGVDAPLFSDKKVSSPPFGTLDPTLAFDPLIQRVDELLAAGLTVEASTELSERQESFMKQYGTQRALPILFDRYLRGADFFHTHRLAERFGGGALRTDPQADANARAWWEHIYPRAYREYVEKYGPTGENPPYYLYTIMQKESAYNPHDVSYADAIGLLQMIPPTSKRVGEKIDYPYTDDILYDPEGNIRFGAWYIGHLLKKFHGQLAIGAGSYNAGPRAMMKWLQKNGDRPLDEFIELCPYTQTREYMKKALDIYARYVYLYEKDDYLPPLKVDTSPLDDGIDY
jgi:soluble lytic murein transglycosylase